jgi:dienelactone hydrolase
VATEVEATQWKVPFSLNDLFKTPTQSEIRKVRQMWAARDLSPVEPKEITQGRIRFGTVNVLVRVISHRVVGSLHYGAIITPVGAKNGSCAVVVEAKGVSWNYFPLDINTGLNAPGILGSDLSHFVIIAPCFRGEKMIFNGQEFISEGDRTDGWDGAADDALALLNVALESTPAADSTRIFSFGRSRGGSVAMLAAERDKRIKGVVEWAGPTDWFELMGEQGWTQQELVEEGLRIHAKSDETAGQFIERFLLKAIDKTWDLESTRLKMIASSPLYFVSTLPPLQIHHGVEDNSVPIVNARALADSLKKAGRAGHDLEADFYEGSGHDTDVQFATKRSHNFLRERSKSMR